MGRGTSQEPPRPGLVVASSGRRSKVRDEAGRIHSCTARSRLEPMVCGDRILWSRLADGSGLVVELLPRTSLLARPRGAEEQRPIAANVDRILLVVAPAPPCPDILIDRYLVTAAHLEIPVRLVINKMDLLDPAERTEARFRRFEKAGSPVSFCSAQTGEGIPELADVLSDETSVFVGPSGVGKSSLTQELAPAEEITVGPLARSGKLGRHTTSAATLYLLPNGGRLIDSPGVREFGLWQVPSRRIAGGFPEFRPFLADCRFRDCMHRSEPGCAVLAAAARSEIAEDRIASYHNLLEEAAEVGR